MKIILGTVYEHRKEVLEEMGYTNFEVMVADIDEKAVHLNDAKELSLALANAKADELQKRIEQPVLLITADQVVGWKDEIREKPESTEQASEYLRTYYLAPAYTTSAVAVTNTATGKRVAGVNVVKIIFRQIPEDVIEKLIKEGSIFSRAGGYEVRDPLLMPYMKSMEGGIDSVMGLPKELTECLITAGQY